MKRLFFVLVLLFACVGIASADTLIVYTTNASDGHITVTGDNQPFSTLRNSASGTATTTTMAYTYPQIVSDSTSGAFYQIHRVALIFDTSGLPDDAIITSVNVSLAKYYRVTDLGDVGIAVTGFTIDGTLSNDDFNNFGYTPFSDYINVSDMTDNVYYNWSLNADGIAAIDKTGNTGFGLLTEYDILNTAPGWIADKSTRANFRTADYVLYPPLLQIEYTEADTTPPDFISNVTCGNVPFYVMFNDTSTGANITFWNWSFGDGNYSSLEDDINLYSLPGLYTVKHSVNDGLGNISWDNRTGYIRAVPDWITCAAASGTGGGGSSGFEGIAILFGVVGGILGAIIILRRERI